MKHLNSSKDKKKFIRSILQGIIFVALIFLLINASFSFAQYEHYDSASLTDAADKGFIALSYFAVDRKGDKSMISVARLEEHFEALRKNGYVTLKQEDIENYYKNNQRIPEKAMFLMFEDGRRDTAMFTDSLLKKYNYVGTMLSYGKELTQKDPKFLNFKELRDLKESTFWELGTNGYRLAYINVLDRYGNYLGELDPEELSALKKYIDRDYNHYLMDFIRDEDKIPKESYDLMRKRIEQDYILIEETYQQKLNEMPKLYALMHSNTGQYGTDKNASLINEKMTKKYFTMNFNREGFALNDKSSDIYDLTRLQPQAYWYPNHLLMRIQGDTKEKMVFMDGDTDIKKDWDTLSGVAEFRKSALIITSEPEARGLIRLNKSKGYQDFNLHTTLTGNILGTQIIYLRANEELNEYIAVKIKNNYLYIEESGKELFALDLNELDGEEYQLIEENRLEALEQAYKIYNKNIRKYKNQTNMEPQEKPEDRELIVIENGTKDYIPEIQIDDPGKRKVDIYLQNNTLTVNIDNKEAVRNLPVFKTEAGYIYLESAWSEYGYSQRNLADDVYDGVFEDLVITETDDEKKILYINKLQGIELVKEMALQRWNKILDWFIENL
ncbi:MAG TPA: glycoside hydrolase [Peptococcaceae bacterium]|nr:glycoside hydrolase [Peptococcaceae bacterium]